MRIAVGLPSLDAQALHRRSIDAMTLGLVERGHDVEGFTEHDRVDENPGFAVHHYLRMPARHAAEPFEIALYPLGRDASPYQGVFWLMQQMPSVAWFLDPSVHNLAVGGVAFMDRWAAYREMLADDDEVLSPAVAQTVARNWGTGAVFRRFDLAGSATAEQPGVLAAWPALAKQLTARGGRDVGVAYLGMVDDVAEWEQEAAGSGRLPRIAITTTNESYAVSAMKAAAAIFAIERHAHVSVCVSAPVYFSVSAPAARHLGIHDRIDWVLNASSERLAEVARDAGMLLFLAEDLRASDRLLLVHALAAGKVVLVPDCPLYDDLPEGVVVKTDLGSALVPTLDATVRALIGDEGLRQGLRQTARDFGAGYPDIDEATAQLEARLVALAATCAPVQKDVARRTWAAVATDLSDAVVPGGASAATRRHIEELLPTSSNKWHSDR